MRQRPLFFVTKRPKNLARIVRWEIDRRLRLGFLQIGLYVFFQFPERHELIKVKQGVHRDICSGNATLLNRG